MREPDVSLRERISLTGRTAVITGASRGIGLAAATAMHELGANIVVTARSRESAEAAADQIGCRAVGIGAHASDERAAATCVRRTIDQFGSFDILVNNAGTNPAYGPLLTQDQGRFAKTFEVNLWAPIMWTSLAADAWMREHGGVVINTGSVGGLKVARNLGLYHASKAALHYVTQQLAFELGPAIRVNAVAPYLVRTRLAEALWKDHERELAESLPLQRIGEPEDVGDLIAFLASDAGAWHTGQTLVVDGGYLSAAADVEPGADE